MKCYKCVRELKVHVVARAAGVGICMHFNLRIFHQITNHIWSEKQCGNSHVTPKEVNGT